MKNIVKTAAAAVIALSTATSALAWEYMTFDHGEGVIRHGMVSRGDLTGAVPSLNLTCTNKAPDVTIVWLTYNPSYVDEAEIIIAARFDGGPALAMKSWVSAQEGTVSLVIEDEFFIEAGMDADQVDLTFIGGDVVISQSFEVKGLSSALSEVTEACMGV